MNSSTNLNQNIIEKKKIIIQFVGSFSGISKWILYIIKVDLAVGSLFCNEQTINSSIEKRCSNNMKFSVLPPLLYIIIGIISLILTLLACVLSSLININIDFQKKNPLKPQVSLTSITCFATILVYIFFSYVNINNSFIATYIIALLYCFIQLKEYILSFPIVGKSILCLYGNLNLLYLLGAILILIRDQSHTTLEDNSHLIIFLLIGSVLCGCNHIFVKIQYYKLYSINLKQSYCKPIIACSYLSEICELSQKSVKDNQSWLILMGILELHQTECEDQYCPCQEGSIFEGLSETEIREKKKEFQQMSLDQGLAIPPQGIWLSELRKDFIEFKQWMEDFIEYHFYQIVEYQGKNNRVKKEIYVYFYFWSFEIYSIRNYVKALYLMKQHYGQIKNKSKIFLVIEECVSMIIESLIKERDKSLIYSNKQGDIQDAMLVRKFSHLFHSEFKVVKYKKRLTEIINSKIDICDKLINNYSSLQNFNRDVKTLVKVFQKYKIQSSNQKTDQIEKELRIALSGDPENVHYLKLLSLINQVLFCHPQSSFEYEGQLNDITTRDRSLEKDVIHSLSIINGDVASIVMSYKDQKCLIERYSNRTPNFFGYKNEEFKLVKNPDPFIPDVIAVYHNYYVGRIVREGNPKILRRYRQLVAKNKVNYHLNKIKSKIQCVSLKYQNGFLFPVKLFADYFFNIHDSLCFSALVLKLQTNCEYILVEHDGYIQGFSEGFFGFLRETSRCYELDPNLLMQANLKLIFPSLLEFLNKYDENGITPNMTNHFTMEIPLSKKYFQRFNKKIFMDKEDQYQKYDKTLLIYIQPKLNQQQNLNSNLAKNIRMTIIKVYLYFLISSQRFFFYKKGLNEYIKEFLQRRSQLSANHGVNTQSKKLEFVKKLLFYFIKLSTKFFKEQTTVYDVQMRITKDFLSFRKDNQMIQQKLFVLEITNMSISKTVENVQPVNHQRLKKNSTKDDIQKQKYNHSNINQEQLQLSQQNEVDQNKRDQKFNQQDVKGLFIHNNQDEIRMEEMELAKINNERNMEQNPSMNVIQSLNDIQAKKQIPQQSQRLDLGNLNMKQQQSQSPRLNISQFNDNKMKGIQTQITLNKYQDISSQNDQKQTPASVNIRRQRSRQEELDQSDISQVEQEKHELDELNKKLQFGFKEIIEGENMKDALSQESGKMMSDEEVEKEYQKFCSQTSYVNSHLDDKLQNVEQNAKIAQIINKEKDVIEEKIQEDDENNNENNKQDQQGQEKLHKNSGDFDDEDEEEDLDQQMKNEIFQSRKKTENSQNGNYKSIVETSNKMTHADKKSRRKAEGNSNSYNDQGMAINQNVKEIAKIATDRTTPVFVKNLYIMFTFQWTVFIIIAIVSCLNYYQNFSAFQTSIDIMSFSANILQGQARTVLSANFMLMDNLKLLDFSSDPMHSTLLNHILPMGYNTYQTNLFQSLQWPLSYPGLDVFQKTQINFDLWAVKTQRIIKYEDIPVPSCLRMIGMSIHQIVQNQNKTYLNQVTYPRELVVNLKNILESFNKTNEDIINSIDDDKAYFSRLNLVVLIIGLFSIICSFGLIFKSLHILQTQEKKILGLISRISEDDALNMIALLELSRDCVAVSNQDYLTVNLRAFDEKNNFEKRSIRQSQKVKQKKIKSNYLNDRIAINRLNSSYSYFIISILLVLSCATLLLGFINFQQLIQNFQSPLDHNNNFLISFNKYSAMIMNFDTLIANKVLKEKQKQSEGLLTSVQEEGMTSDLKEQLAFWKQYSNKEYSELSEGIISDDFASHLRNINEQDSCELVPKIFDDIENQQCKQYMSGLMTKGFVPEINSILNQIDSAIRSAFSDSIQLMFYMEKENYKDQIKVSTLLINIFNRIKDLLHDSITQLLDNYGQITILLFTCGSIGYTILLISGFSYFYITSFRDFQYLRRGVILMPYQRLALDNHTMNLLNNTLQIKK